MLRVTADSAIVMQVLIKMTVHQNNLGVPKHCPQLFSSYILLSKQFCSIFSGALYPTVKFNITRLNQQCTFQQHAKIHAWYVRLHNTCIARFCCSYNEFTSYIFFLSYTMPSRFSHVSRANIRSIFRKCCKRQQYFSTPPGLQPNWLQTSRRAKSRRKRWQLLNRLVVTLFVTKSK